MKTVPTTRFLSTKAFCAFLSILLLAYAAASVCGQRRATPEADELAKHRELQTAISSVERGSPAEALAAMKDAVDHNKDSATVWYYYGTALSRNGDFEGAIKAFRQAQKLDSNFIQARFRLARTLLMAGQTAEAEKESRRALGSEAKSADAHYVFGEIYLLCGDAQGALGEANTLLRDNNSSAPALLLRSEAKLLTLTTGGAWRPENREQLRQTLKDALDSLEKYFAVAEPKGSDAYLREQLDALRFYAKQVEGDSQRPDRQVFFPNETTTKPHVFSKTQPRYTESARSVRLQGGVMLCVALGAGGSIEHILVLRTLPFGLTGTSIEAAKQVKFTPATKDGHPVSVLTQLEYNFNLY